ncbi:MAG: hypothetical protein ABIB61_01550 [Candidatus Shapirobacteria bacterium]
MREIAGVDQGEESFEIRKETRWETRFAVEPSRVNDVRMLLETVFQRQPYSGQEVQTVYYATREFNLPRNSYVRGRRYIGPMGFLEASREFLEVKVDGTGGVVTKTRAPCNRGDVGKVLKGLGSGYDLESLVQIGLDRGVVYQAMANIGPRPLLPLIETISQREYFSNGVQRVTLDFGEQYWGYFGEGREKRLLLSESSGGRLEIKALSKKGAEQALRMILSYGIDLQPCEGRRKEFQYLYLAVMEELAHQRSLQEFTYEVPGKEVEAKLQVVNTENPLLLVDQIFSEVTEGLISGFKAMPGKEVIKEWEFHFINYGLVGPSGMEEVVVVVTDPEVERFAVKKKGPPVVFEGSPTLVRTEVVSKYLGQFEGSLKSKIIEDEEVEAGSKLVELGEVVRRKRYTYITNASTGRNYKVSVDFCTSGVHQMSQLEIEYMGRIGILPITENMVNEIVAEINVLALHFLEKYDNCLFLTNLTKFQWLVSLQK